MGMVCGGEVRVLIQLIDASDVSQSRIYQDLAAAIASSRQKFFVTRIPRESATIDYPHHGLAGKDVPFAGNLDPATVREVVARFAGREPGTVRYGENDFLVEPLCREGTVFIFGAGHISKELAPLVKTVGFRSIIIDDRQEFANRDRFPCSDAVLVLDSFDEALKGLDIDEEGYVVLVTRGHAHDRDLLRQAIFTNARYIGMIGSRKKRDAVYESLLKEGVSRVDLERVHCPIGLDIGAETPEEIAMSIVAELIQVRAGKRR
jgi:xanthine dehydrogenase accessory factor